jgi:predicted nucleotidyltransferase
MTTTSTSSIKARAGKSERIDVTYDYAVCAWARHFNVSEKRVKEAVAAVGNEAEVVRAHLKRTTPSERPSGF